MNDIEQNAEKTFVQTFVLRDKQQRYIELLANPKKRPKILDHLNHKFDYNAKYAYNIHDCESIFKFLKAKGAPENCHVIAAGHELDGSDVALDTAIDALWSHAFAYLIICDPKHLAYFQAEAPSKPIVFMKE